MSPPFDLRLVFDREHRTYRAGERATGRVEIRTGEDVASRGVLLRWFWTTEGAGNRDRGTVHEEVLVEGLIPAGPAHEIPFSIPVPPGPFTYRGHLIRLGHRVQVKVDMPWASDRQVTEEVVVVPGPSAGMPPAVLTRSRPVKDPAGRRTALTIGGIVSLLAGLSVLAVLGFLLVPLGVVLIAAGVWRAVARAKLGDVDLRVSSRVISPGQPLEVRLAFQPRKPVTINGAEARLTCREVAQSGSGKNRKVRRHEVYAAPTRMRGPDRARAEERVELRAVVAVPDRPAYSLATDHNQVEWKLRVQVDIPSWPDFVQEEELILWPGGEALEESPGKRRAALVPRRKGAPPKPALPAPRGQESPAAGLHRSVVEAVDAYRSQRAAAEGSPAAETRPGPGSARGLARGAAEAGELTGAARGARVREPARTAGHEGASESAGTTGHQRARKPAGPARGARARKHPAPPGGARARKPAGTARDAGTPGPAGAARHEPEPTPAVPAVRPLADALSAVLAADRWTGERRRLLHALLGETVDFDLVVERRERTFGDLEPGFRGGRTVVGTVAPAGHEVVVRFPETRNAEIDRLRRGDAMRARGRVAEWQALYERPLVKAVDGDG